jgi:hypothetical protein
MAVMLAKLQIIAKINVVERQQTADLCLASRALRAPRHFKYPKRS